MSQNLILFYCFDPSLFPQNPQIKPLQQYFSTMLVTFIIIFSLSWPKIEEVPIKLKTSSRLKMSYLLFVCSGQPRDVPKRVMPVQSCCFGDKLDLTFRFFFYTVCRVESLPLMSRVL